MEERKSSRTIWIVLGILVAFLFMCGVSAVVGGVAGYVAGREVAQQRLKMPIEPYVPEAPMPDWDMPRPTMPEMPFGAEQFGAMIVEVIDGGPADKAGFQAGDVIWEVDGMPLSEESDLAALIDIYEPGDEVELLVTRRGGGRTRLVTVELGRHPERGGESPYLGVTYRTISEGLRMPEWDED